MSETDQRLIEPVGVTTLGGMLRCTLHHGALEQQWWGPGHTSVLRGAARQAARRRSSALLLMGGDGVFWHTMAGVPSTQRALHGSAVEEACACLERCEVPTVAFINGACEGVGLALALHCGRIVARPDREARIWIGHTRGLAQRWPLLMRRLVLRVGEEGARALVVEGQVWSAQQALERGLVDALVEDEGELRGALLAELGPATSAQLPSRPAEDEERAAARFWARQSLLWAAHEGEAPAFGSLLVMERMARHTTTQALCTWLEQQPTRGLRVMRSVLQAAGREEGRIIGALLSSYDQPPPKRGTSTAEDITVHNILSRELPWRGRQLLTHHLPAPLELLPVVECASAAKGPMVASHRAWRLGMQRAGLHVLTTRPQRLFVLEQLVVALCRGLVWGAGTGTQQAPAWLGALPVEQLGRLLDREGRGVRLEAVQAAMGKADVAAMCWALWGQGALLLARGEVGRIAEVEGFIWRALGCAPHLATLPESGRRAPVGLLDEAAEEALRALMERSAERGAIEWSAWVS
jgi:enoyl-CoA hydratase/carnithine racemase